MMKKLAYALQMEIDGEQYYLTQARRNKGNAMKRAFQLLAGAEHKHAAILRNMLTLPDVAEIGNMPPEEPENLFADKEDFKRDAAVLPGQLEVYEIALEMELKSINFYQDMLAGAKDEKTMNVLMFLINEEKKHYAFFEELTELLRCPRDWVESAEFGTREEY